MVTPTAASSDDVGHGVVVQADGKIVVAGYTANGIDTEFALMRINP